MRGSRSRRDERTLGAKKEFRRSFTLVYLVTGPVMMSWVKCLVNGGGEDVWQWRSGVADCNPHWIGLKIVPLRFPPIEMEWLLAYS